ncbi:carbohydrate-binding domain-containing protein [Butyrivibrio sp. INlla16]|uniref:carbohydrate-binding domain-containing protein n=1 Tax=Butyrivibrio sp. INlla16 TaxID=1520807 RepID=UPI000889F1A4|nr:carbohydrate-binding domain-containing protein [Butyrivibrio sp. INlla16]SDB69843.1 hypothetical protein SAMN02910263_04560 [Butyrivibrio sp. INlla16]
MRNTAIKSAMYCLILFVIILLRNGISSNAAYQLYIGNEDHSDNDISATSPPTNLHGANWNYEASSKTLTLSNFHYEGEGVEGIHACIYCTFPITIYCNGNNTIVQNRSNVSSGNYSAIYSHGDTLKITGPGTLDLTSSKHGIHCPLGDVDILNISNLHITPAQVTSDGYGIYGKSIRIGGAYVTIDADNANQGIHAENMITINHTNAFTATGKISALYAVSGVKNDIVGNGWTNIAGTEGKMLIPVTAVGTDRSSFKKVQFPILRNDPTVTPPSAKDLYSTGSAQELVNPGSTSGGTLYCYYSRSND